MAARPATSQYRPWSRGKTSPAAGAPVSPPPVRSSGPASPAAPENNASASEGGKEARAGSNSWRTTPNAKSRSSSRPRHERDHVVFPGQPRRRHEEGTLADSRRALDHDHPACAGAGRIGQTRQGVQLVLTFK